MEYLEITGVLISRCWEPCHFFQHLSFPIYFLSKKLEFLSCVSLSAVSITHFLSFSDSWNHFSLLFVFKKNL